jgi:hypothetical protein
MYQIIKREILLFIQFGIISLIATTVAFNHFDGVQREFYLGIVNDNSRNPSLNPYEMISWTWQN